MFDADVSKSLFDIVIHTVGVGGILERPHVKVVMNGIIAISSNINGAKGPPFVGMKVLYIGASIDTRRIEKKTEVVVVGVSEPRILSINITSGVEPRGSQVPSTVLRSGELSQAEADCGSAGSICQ